MARGVNKVILLGRLGQDPVVRYTAGGAAVTSFSVATSEGWRDKSSGEMQERTEWHNVVIFSRLAEIAGQYLKKGSQVYLEGRLQTRKWTDKQGMDRYTTEIVAHEMQMLDSRGGGGQYSQTQAPSQGGTSYQDFNQDRPQGGQQNRQGQGSMVNQPSGQGSGFSQNDSNPMSDFEDFDDDIPF